MELSNNLIKLSNVCNDKNGKIYVVGGAVRNSIMGLPYDDIDICGTFTPDEIMELATTCGFRSQVVNAKLGTVLITADNEQYEYTTFRSENYVKGHSPSNVDFVNDIKVDAARRDFTINALYYDIYTGNVLDFYNGRTDIANKVIKTIETPDFVFASDGLRLLRLIRFASELDFKIDKPTLKQAKVNIYMLNDISAERKLKELRMILFSDFRYGKTNKCIEYFNKLNVYPYLFKLNNFKIKNNWAVPRVMATTLDIRYLSFCVMLLMNKYKFRHIPINQLQFDVNNIFGATGLKDSNANISNLLKVYSVIQNFLFAKNTDVYDILEYTKLDEKLTKCVHVFVDEVKLRDVVDAVKQQGIPMSMDELDITNADLLKIVDDKLVSKIKKTLYELCVLGKISNTFTDLQQVALQLAEQMKKDN